MSPGPRSKTPRKPKLTAGMSAADFKAYYWLKADLVNFARLLGIPAQGGKPVLTAFIEQRLRGRPTATPARRSESATGPRDSDRPLTRRTPVVNYKSDAETRRYFQSAIGAEFHFTYHLNQFRLARTGLTYGDLVDEWIAERDRRRGDEYRAPIAEHGKYNRFVRDYFADAKNRGKSLGDAARAWNAIKNRKGTPTYSRR